MTPAAWAWIGLAILITAYVLAFDLTLINTGAISMSEQFHKWMQSQLVGPIVVGLWVGASTGLIYHFLINKLYPTLEG